MNKVQKFAKKLGVSTLSIASAVSVSAVSVFAAADTGNTDLDILIGSMDTGLNTIKTGGLYIVGALIVVAIVFFGARWLWNIWRSWMAKAQ